MDWLSDATGNLPPFWRVLLFAMLPILELRGAIPWALFMEKMPWLEAYLISVLGNAIPVVPLLLFLGPAE
ncbi:small multi-drug export protein, partial [bacterium]|nr:small multi-drug export protein [bacterium]